MASSSGKNPSPNDLRGWMERRQFTGAAAATSLGVTERTVRNWLAGDTKIPHHLKGRLSR